MPIGKAAVAREGTDVTIVTLSLSVHHALDVAEKLAGDGIEVEVLDLRSLVPLDREAILASVAKTGKLVVVDEDYQSFGLSGEVVATVTDQDPTLLKAPVQRVAVPDVPDPVRPRPRVRRAAEAGAHRGSGAPGGGRMTDVPFPGLSRRTPKARESCRPGSSVRAEPSPRAQLLAEVQVDKVAAEVLAPVAGVVRLLVEEEGVVKQGEPIARID